MSFDNSIYSDGSCNHLVIIEKKSSVAVIVNGLIDVYRQMLTETFPDLVRQVLTLLAGGHQTIRKRRN